MKHEKYLHFGAGVLAVGMSFAADAMGISLSEDTMWMLRGFAVAALGLGTLKHLRPVPSPVTEADSDKDK